MKPQSKPKVGCLKSGGRIALITIQSEGIDRSNLTVVGQQIQVRMGFIIP